jgi:thiol-disulfide isomerase/thioredoxin
MKIIKLGAAWCPGCYIMKPRFAEIEQEEPALQTEYFDVDEHPEMKEKYHYADLPAFIFLDNQGNELLRHYGIVSKKELVNDIIKTISL